MRGLIHRTRIRPAAAEALGPGGTVGPLLRRLTAPLTWVGWLSVAGAAGIAALWVWPYATGARSLALDTLTPLGVLRQLASIATILLPAALEVGYPSVARRNVWLLGGALLLALSQLATPIIGVVEDWASNALYASNGSMDLQFALVQGLSVARVLVSVVGWSVLLCGLALAGARPAAATTAAFVLVGVAAWAAESAPMLDRFWVSDHVLGSAANAAAIVVGLGQSAAVGAVIAALLTGAYRGLPPRMGWRLGAAAGFAMAGAVIVVVELVLEGVSVQAGGQDMALLALLSVLNSASSLLLLAACLAGIGRGSEERRLAWGGRRRTFVVTGERRLRRGQGEL